MKSVNANDIYTFGKVKADIAFILWQLQTDETYSRESAASDLGIVIKEVIDFESYIADVFISESN